jgi:transposase
MIQITPHVRILVALQPVDFRKGIDGLCRVCREVIQKDPFSGAFFISMNQQRTAVRILSYDGQGFWLCHKRLSSGRVLSLEAERGSRLRSLGALELQTLLWNGDLKKIETAPLFHPLSAGLQPP